MTESSTTDSAPTADASPGITITRVFDAPRELVFEAWTDIDGKTDMVFRQTGGNLPVERYEQAKAGWITFFDAMAADLARS